MATVLEPSMARAPAPESSDRSFGLVFAAAFALIGVWPLIRFDAPRWWAIGLALTFAAAALIRPQILHPLNRAWLELGRVLHRIMSPIVMGLIFFVTVAPTGWIMRLLGKDVLSLKRRPDLATYWITREPPAVETESMKNQF
jgi:Saxitoxin biosynthesis operon protein SxtJ